MSSTTSEPLLTIGQVAERAGVNTSHIRFYERTRVLPQPDRVSGQRRYREEVLHRLSIIDVAQRAGLALEEIAPLTGPENRSADTGRHIRALADEKLPADRRADRARPGGQALAAGRAVLRLLQRGRLRAVRRPHAAPAGGRHRARRPPRPRARAPLTDQSSGRVTSRGLHRGSWAPQSSTARATARNSRRGCPGVPAVAGEDPASRQAQAHRGLRVLDPHHGTGGDGAARRDPRLRRRRLAHLCARVGCMGTRRRLATATLRPAEENAAENGCGPSSTRPRALTSGRRRAARATAARRGASPHRRRPRRHAPGWSKAPARRRPRDPASTPARRRS